MPSWFGQLLQVAALALGTWLVTRIKKPSDKEKADLLSVIANDAAVLLVVMMPGASWATMLQALVVNISQAAGLPTKNADAIQRAAASALLNALARANVKATGAPNGAN